MSDDQFADLGVCHQGDVKVVFLLCGDVQLAAHARVVVVRNVADEVPRLWNFGEEDLLILPAIHDGQDGQDSNHQRQDDGHIHPRIEI